MAEPLRLAEIGKDGELVSGWGRRANPGYAVLLRDKIRLDTEYTKLCEEYYALQSKTYWTPAWVNRFFRWLRG